MKLGESIVSGIMGGVWCLCGMWFVFGIRDNPLTITNVYAFVGIAGFFGSFFTSRAYVRKEKIKD